MAVSEGGHSDALLVNVRVDGLDGEQVGPTLESPEVAVDPHRGRKLRRPFPAGRSPVGVQDEVDEVAHGDAPSSVARSDAVLTPAGAGSVGPDGGPARVPGRRGTPRRWGFDLSP